MPDFVNSLKNAVLLVSLYDSQVLENTQWFLEDLSFERYLCCVVSCCESKWPKIEVLRPSHMASY